jgi:hypothetical protein
MNLDDELRERMRSVADRVPAGEPEVRRIARRGKRRARLRVAGVTLSVVAVLGAAGTVGNLVMRTPGAPLGDPVTHGVVGSAGGRAREPRDQVLYANTRIAEHFAGLQATTEDLAATGEGLQAGPTVPAAPAEAEPALPQTGGPGPRVVKTAAIELEVPEGEFQGRYSDAQQVAGAHQGFVIASKTEGQESRVGSLTIRVPVEEFDATLADLRAIGVLRAEETRGEDVTADYIDLQGRLRIWEAQERFLFNKFEQASSIAQSIQIRRQIQDVQFEIEKLRGALRLLRDQSDLATIDVTLYEVGAEVPDDPREGAGPLGGAWGAALLGAERVVAAIVVGLGYVLPVLLFLALVWLGVRALRARLA